MCILAVEPLHRFAERCGGYDRDNRSLHAYFGRPAPGDVLPKDRRRRNDAGRADQREVPSHLDAPDTALGVYMHLDWVAL
jgi:hypothetical protein